METAQGAREGTAPTSTPDSPSFLPCGSHTPATPKPHPPPPPAQSFSWAGAVPGNALGGQLGQHVIQVVGIWVAVASEVRAEPHRQEDLLHDGV